MVNYCVAVNCEVRAGQGFSFHRFPKDEELRKAWCHAIRRKNFIPTEHSRICSKHFKNDDYDPESFGYPKLKEGRVPSVFQFPKNVGPTEIQERKSPLKRESPEVALSSFTAPPPVDGVDEKRVRVSCKRKSYIGDFQDRDLLSPTRAQQFLEVTKIRMEEKLKTIADLRRKNSNLTAKVLRMQAMIDVLKKKMLKNEATSVNHDVSSNLELELTTTDSASDQEMAIKEEPMSEPEEGGASGYQNVYDPSTVSDTVSRPGTSTVIVPSVLSVKSLAERSSGEILGMPVSELPSLSCPPPSQSVSGDNPNTTNGVLEKYRLQPNPKSSNESGDETKVLPEYRTRDQFDVYGEYIASKLRRLDWRTCAHVQKAFGDIIFEAEMGKYNQGIE